MLYFPEVDLRGFLTSSQLGPNSRYPDCVGTKLVHPPFAFGYNCSLSSRLVVTVVAVKSVAVAVLIIVVIAIVVVAIIITGVIIIVNFIITTLIN